jgi:uncharacterized protein YihD (DUF1040 family)
MVLQRTTNESEFFPNVTQLKDELLWTNENRDSRNSSIIEGLKKGNSRINQI